MARSRPANTKANVQALDAALRRMFRSLEARALSDDLKALVAQLQGAARRDERAG